MYLVLTTVTFLRSADFLPSFAGCVNSTLVSTFPVFLFLRVCVPCTTRTSPPYCTRLPGFSCVLCLRTVTYPFFTLCPRYGRRSFAECLGSLRFVLPQERSWPAFSFLLQWFLKNGLRLPQPRTIRGAYCLSPAGPAPQGAVPPRQCYPAVLYPPHTSPNPAGMFNAAAQCGGRVGYPPVPVRTVHVPHTSAAPGHICR